MSGTGGAVALGTMRRGVAISAAARLLQVVLAFAMLAVVGRVIGAEAYGVFAMALVAVALGEIVVGGGLTESLVQRQDVEPGHEAASFWCVLAAGILMCGGIALLRQPIAGLFGEPMLAELLPAVALALPITALGAVPFARLQRGLRFGAMAGIDTVAAIVSGSLCIALALLGWHVWSLVLAELVRVSIRSAGVFRVARWAPQGTGRLRHLRDLMAFNAGSLGTRALGTIDRMLPRALIGMLLGSQALGFYVVAWRLYEQLNAVLIHPLNAIALPLAARAQADPAALRALLARAIRLTSAVAFPAYLGMAALAPLVVPLIMGPGWAGAVPLVQIMLLLGLRSAMTSFNGGVLRGLGRPGLQVPTILVGTALTLILVPLAAPFGVVAVTFAVAVRRFATWPITARQVQRLTGFDWRAQTFAAAPNLLAALVMAAGVWALQHAGRGTMPDIWLLLLAVLLGLLVYPVVLAIAAPGSMRELRARLSHVAGRARARLVRVLRPAQVQPERP